MLLGYIYNTIILNLLLKNSNCICQERVPQHSKELNEAKQWNFYELLCNVYVTFSTFKNVY